MHSLLLLLLGLIGPSLCQEDESTINPDLDIRSCDALSCAEHHQDAICSSGSNDEIGVGLVSKAIDVSDDVSLSLTLIDGNPSGEFDSSVYDYSTRTLYVGAPPDADLSNQPAGCALMMQHESTTFPYIDSTKSNYNFNSTTCPSELLASGSTASDLSTYIDDFRYSNSSSYNGLDRCQALAQYVEGRIHAQLTFASYYATLVSVKGGAISGRDVGTNNTEISNDAGTIYPQSCQPVLPQDYVLHNITSMTQILRGNSSDQSNIPSTAESSVMGGRTGYTPVVSVMYDEDDDSAKPTIRVYCMHIYETDGSELPYSQLDRESAANIARWSVWLGLLAVGLSVWTILP